MMTIHEAGFFLDQQLAERGMDRSSIIDVQVSFLRDGSCLVYCDVAHETLTVGFRVGDAEHDGQRIAKALLNEPKTIN